MRITLALLASIILFATSCKKDSAPDNNVPTTNDSILLSKVVVLDTTKTAPLDTMDVSYYSYDNSKRVTVATLYGYDGTGTIKSTEIYKYSYTGADTLPSKMLETYSDASEQINSTSFYAYYPGTRNVSWDSTIFREINPPYTFEDTSVSRYIYTNDFVTITSEFYTSSGQQVNPPHNIYITKQNGNIVSQRDTISNAIAESYSCTYDTHKNPYYNVAWYNNLSIVSTYKTYPDGFGLNNNVTEINNTSKNLSNPTSIETTHYKYTYTYRADGYPVEIIMKDMGSTYPTTSNKIKYYYTK
jgi:hypothetical protein